MAEINGNFSEGTFKGKPLRLFHGKYKSPSNDPEFQGGKYLGKEFEARLDLAIHPNLSRRVIINMPGANGDIDGYEEKYKVLAHYMQSENGYEPQNLYHRLV